MIVRSKRLGILMAVVAMTVGTAFAQPTSQPATSGSAQTRVTFDRQCFTIDGKDTLIYSAAFHYFRCPKELWRDRFTKLKEAGFNTVETYAAWNWHERQPPKDVDDFSQVDLSELDEWLTMAEKEFGFYTIVRPGPYICAEWDGGGYPQWLTLHRPANYRGMWYRSDDPEYLRWCRHWYQAVAKTVVPHLITKQPQGGRGVIFWQIENEYNYAGKPADEMLGQLLALGKMSQELGIDVPLFTCVSHNATLQRDPWLKANVFDTMNTYPGFNITGMGNGMRYLDEYQPNKPKAITELQGGWFATLGNKLSDQQGHTAAQIQHLTLFAWENGFTSTNYYMAFGGTNLGDWASASLMTSYDYNAPLREPGGVGDRYLAVKGMGQFIAEYGPKLARTTPLRINLLEKTDDPVNVVVRKADSDGTLFVFARTEFRDGPQHGTIRFVPEGAPPDAQPIAVYYDLPPFGAQVCVVPPGEGQHGTWYPKPQAAPHRPTTLPAPIEVTEAKRKDDSLLPQEDSAWRELARGASVEDMGIFDRRTTVYRIAAPLGKAIREAGKQPVLRLQLRDRDDATVLVDGRRLPALGRDGSEASYSLEHVTPSENGDADVAVIYENGGRPNGGQGMERRNGLGEVWITDRALSARSLTGWRMRLLDDPTDRSLVGPDVDDKDWRPRRESNEGDLPPDRTAIYRSSIELTADEIQAGRSINLACIDDRGFIYVNGTLIGESTNWSEPFIRDVTAQLKPGRNTIAVIVTNTQGSGGLVRGTSLVPKAAHDPAALGTHWKFAPGTAGMLAGWQMADVDDSGWQSFALTGRPLSARDFNSPLVWYRMKFTPPAADPHVWVPWFARLNITGNAFLYLNGQPLGRYWNAGPQRDFYLPENWLKLGQENVLTAAVRPIEGAEVRSMTVMPYAEQAEVREDRQGQARGDGR